MRDRPVADGPPVADPLVADDDDGPLPGMLILVTIVVSVAALAVALTMLSARGIGPFAGPSPDSELPSETATIEVAAVAASSSLEPEGATTYDAANLIDGDPTTAWNEGESGDGEGQWVDLVLERPSIVTGVLLWNGYQSGDFYAQHNRVRRVQLVLGDDRTFAVQLLDRRGPQAINLPEPVTTSRIRLEIAGTFPGSIYNDAALSELEVRGVP